MQALHPRVVDAVWAAVEGLLPLPVDDHPLGCHRPRIHDRICFEGIVYRLVLGCSWTTAARLLKTSATTLRRRRDEWIAAGVFDALCDQALAGYDRVKGLDLSEVSIDGSLHKAPCGGEGTGRNPTDRGKLGWKWSLATDRDGIPIGWAIDGANRNDIKLFEPTLNAIEGRGLLTEIETLHLDRGYDAAGVRELCATSGITDAVIAKKRKRGEGKNVTERTTEDKDNDDKDEQRTANAPSKGNARSKGNGDKQSLGLGLRWAVERSNSWFSNFGQLRRNTDRRTIHRMAQIALAVTLILTVKLFKWADRWSPAATPT
ncbi:MAG: IS5 family transposase [Egibacteraceae bacterium]